MKHLWYTVKTAFKWYTCVSREKMYTYVYKTTPYGVSSVLHICAQFENDIS